MKNIFTCESVGRGHPDKVCDQIADAILDECLAKDKNSRCAIECLISKGKLIIAGEVSCQEPIDYEKIARKVLQDVGYSENELDFDPINSKIEVLVKEQSSDIYQAVFKDELGAGDQGIMFGYATKETEEYLPIGYVLANEILKMVEQKRLSGEFKDAKSDMKCQVSYDYQKNKVTTILVSIQHQKNANMTDFKDYVSKEIVNKVIEKRQLNKDFDLIINPSGRFIIGGPAGDCGVTGRKIIVDSYGGVARSGGGAFSGKDPSKVDRSAAYGARYICKNIVAAGLADRCELQLSYAIGLPKPTSIYLKTFDSEHCDKDKILEIIDKTFDLSVSGLIKTLDLKNTKYYPVAAYGHFGRLDLNLPWERLDKVETIKKLI